MEAAVQGFNIAWHLIAGYQPAKNAGEKRVGAQTVSAMILIVRFSDIKTALEIGHLPVALPSDRDRRRQASRPSHPPWSSGQRGRCASELCGGLLL